MGRLYNATETPEGLKSPFLMATNRVEQVRDAPRTRARPAALRPLAPSCGHSGEASVLEVDAKVRKDSTLGRHQIRLDSKTRDGQRHKERSSSSLWMKLKMTVYVEYRQDCKMSTHISFCFSTCDNLVVFYFCKSKRFFFPTSGVRQLF